MGCGCGKGRQGTAEVKDRKRATMGMNAAITGQATGATNPAYNKRLSEYNQTLREYMRGK